MHVIAQGPGFPRRIVHVIAQTIGFPREFGHAIAQITAFPCANASSKFWISNLCMGELMAQDFLQNL